MSVPVTWRLKKRFWAHWQALRFRLSKPQDIGPPRPNKNKIRVVPFAEANDQIPLREVLVYERLPKEEARLGMRVLVSVGLFLTRIVRPMRAGLPEIDADIDEAVASGVSKPYRKAFRGPVRPAVYAGDGPVELGELATRSPYSLLLESRAGQLQWDLRFLGDFEHHDGLRRLAVQVRFDQTDGELTAVAIDSDEYGAVHPGSPEWDAAATLAICAATTHTALTRHFNYVHLISGNHWDVATRNHLPADHPLYRLVWPHIFNSLYTNHGVSRVQLLPDGDFVNMFSFTHTGLMQYFDTMHVRYDIAMTDPDADWERRGLVAVTLACPTQQNLRELFGVMHAHTTRYIDAYYGSDEELRADQAVVEWLDALDQLVPNGLGLDRPITREALARLTAAYIYEGNTIHDLVGTTLWDYQLWADRNPTRVYLDGRRVPVDVFQRVVNNNFALQLRRAPMLADYRAVALDEKGAALFSKFHDECRALQDQYDLTPAGPWRMEPKNLEINMNG